MTDRERQTNGQLRMPSCSARMNLYSDHVQRTMIVPIRSRREPDSDPMISLRVVHPGLRVHVHDLLAGRRGRVGGQLVLVQAHEDDRESVGNADHDESGLGRGDAVVVEDRLGQVVAQEEEDGVDVVEHEDEGGRDEGEGNGAAAGEEPGERGQERGQEEDAQLKLDDEPLILELIFGTLGVGNDVGGRLEHVVVRVDGGIHRGRVLEDGQGVGLPLEERWGREGGIRSWRVRDGEGGSGTGKEGEGAGEGGRELERGRRGRRGRDVTVGGVGIECWREIGWKRSLVIFRS